MKCTRILTLELVPKFIVPAVILPCKVSSKSVSEMALTDSTWLFFTEPHFNEHKIYFEGDYGGSLIFQLLVEEEGHRIKNFRTCN